MFLISIVEITAQNYNNFLNYKSFLQKKFLFSFIFCTFALSNDEK